MTDPLPAPHGTDRERAAHVHILLVDDEPHIVRSLTRALRQPTWQLHGVTNPWQAIELAASVPCAVVISDYRMPEMTGSECLAKIREIAPDTRRVLLTGYADLEGAMAAVNSGGIMQYLTKPWDDGQLLGIIHRAVDSYQGLQHERALSTLTATYNQELSILNASLETRVLERTTEIAALNQQLAAQWHASLQMLAQLGEIHSQTIGRHAQRVALIARDLANSAGLNAQQQEHIAIAALLHDLGKIALPTALLLTPAHELTPREQRGLARHVEVGEAIARMIPNLGDVPLWIRHHHEAFDGTGYPDKLRGQAIPLGARIIALANRYDHACYPAPPEHPRLPEQALRIVASAARSHDPALLTALTEIVRTDNAPGPNTDAREVRPSDLAPGMRIARNLHAPWGALLVAEGTLLTAPVLQRLRQHFSQHPLLESIWIGM